MISLGPSVFEEGEVGSFGVAEAEQSREGEVVLHPTKSIYNNSKQLDAHDYFWLPSFHIGLGQLGLAASQIIEHLVFLLELVDHVDSRLLLVVDDRLRVREFEVGEGDEEGCDDAEAETDHDGVAVKESAFERVLSVDVASFGGGVVGFM